MKSQTIIKDMKSKSKLLLLGTSILVGAIIFLFYKMSELHDKHVSLEAKFENIIDELSGKDRSSIEATQQNVVAELPSEKENLFYGINISHWNGDVINEISDEIDITFVICKATQGKSYIDPEFKYNWQSIKQINKIRGAYHFYMYNDDPTSQAKHFCDVVSDIEITDLSLILDVEELSVPKGTIDKNKFKNDLITFLDFVEQRTKRIPILYTNYSFANQYLDDTRFSKYPLWLAEYSKADKPKIPNAWKDKGFFIWQKSNSFSIHSTKVDYDVFYGNIEGLVK